MIPMKIRIAIWLFLLEIQQIICLINKSVFTAKLILILYFCLVFQYKFQSIFQSRIFYLRCKMTLKDIKSCLKYVCILLIMIMWCRRRPGDELILWLWTSVVWNMNAQIKQQMFVLIMNVIGLLWANQSIGLKHSC